MNSTLQIFAVQQQCIFAFGIIATEPIQSFEYLSQHICNTVRGSVLVSVAWGHWLVCRWQLMDGGCGRIITEKPCRMLRVEASKHVIGKLGHPALWAPKMTHFQSSNDVISSWHANTQLNKMSRLSALSMHVHVDFLFASRGLYRSHGQPQVCATVAHKGLHSVWHYLLHQASGET